MNFFTNFFIILKSDYQSRMIKYAGYCENEGYGFAKYIKKKYQLNENFLIRNFNNSPNIHGYFFNINQISNNNKIILIGASEQKLRSFTNKGFRINDSFNNCFYISK